MGRQAKFSVVLKDQTRVGYSLKKRSGIFRVQFINPETPDKYREVSTGCRTQSDAHIAASKIIESVYSPEPIHDPKKVSWDKVVDDLKSSTSLRPRSLEVYTSMIKIFCSFVDSKGPYDVTLINARQFRRDYATCGFKRSNDSDAKEYKRSAKTIENAIRRLSGLWGHLKKMGYVIENPWETIPRPTVPKKLPVIPSEDDVQDFFNWLNSKFPGWDLPHVFVEIKALSGCRLNDLCQIRSSQFNLAKCELTIKPEQDKTHRERIIPLPEDLAKRLNAIKGKTYLWESYNQDALLYRKGPKSREEFSQDYFYNAMKTLFRDYGKTGGKLRSHGLRKRAITLLTLVSQSVDATAQAIGIDSQTAKKYYLDASKAFKGTELLKKMEGVLRLKSDEKSKL